MLLEINSEICERLFMCDRKTASALYRDFIKELELLVAEEVQRIALYHQCKILRSASNMLGFNKELTQKFEQVMNALDENNIDTVHQLLASLRRDAKIIRRILASTRTDWIEDG